MWNMHCTQCHPCNAPRAHNATSLASHYGTQHSHLRSHLQATAATCNRHLLKFTFANQSVVSLVRPTFEISQHPPTMRLHRFRLSLLSFLSKTRKLVASMHCIYVIALCVASLSQSSVASGGIWWNVEQCRSARDRQREMIPACLLASSPQHINTPQFPYSPPTIEPMSYVSKNNQSTEDEVPKTCFMFLSFMKWTCHPSTWCAAVYWGHAYLE